MQTIKNISNEVYSILGPGHPEVIYHRAMEHEFQLRGVLFESEGIVPVKYKNHAVGHFRYDMLVNKKILLECKSSDRVPFKDTDAEVIQLQKYLNIMSSSENDLVGMLINFPKSHKNINECVFRVLPDT